MNTAIKNFFGVAAAILVLLGYNAVTDTNTNTSLSLNNTDTQVVRAEERPVSSLLDLNNAIVDIAEKTNRSVVMITTERERRRPINPFSFFGNPYSNPGDSDTYTQRGLGSGVIVSEDGYILTNNHVIEDVDEIKVQLYEGEEVTAELVGADPQTDIAVLKIDVENAPAIKIGDSDKLKVGSFVLAIGSPLSENLAHTVSFGIVSAKSRNINILRDVAGYEDFIQTDAAINPGNSGGALIDMNGELVGINSAIASRSGGNDGIGFAIPVNLAKRIMDDLIEDGAVSRGYLGIYFGGEVDRTMARGLGLKKDVRGVIISQVEEGGPADKAGLKEADIITTIDGEKVVSWNMFRSQIASKRPGEKVELGIVRNGKEMNIVVTLGERDEQIASVTPKVEEDMRAKLGFTVMDLDADTRNQLQLDDSVDGVVVNRIETTSNAYERGLRRGDVITEVKSRKVETAKEFYTELEKLEKEGDDVVLLTVIRSGTKQFIAFEL